MLTYLCWSSTHYYQGLFLHVVWIPSGPPHYFLFKQWSMKVTSGLGMQAGVHFPFQFRGLVLLKPEEFLCIVQQLL